MTKAIYPGSFDPVTYGQIDIAVRASRLFDELIVAVYANPPKKELFAVDERLAMMAKALAEYDNISVVEYDGLTVDLARTVGANAIVRGLRVVSDFEHEFQMALMNRQLAPDIDVVCLMTSVEYTYLSSGIVKEVALLGGDISPFVPAHVKSALQQRLASLGSRSSEKVDLISLKGE
ncbi:MAG: pantetheine-phosphate adenylyltransferase [Ardenticatenaceae bacterium]